MPVGSMIYRMPEEEVIKKESKMKEIINNEMKKALRRNFKFCDEMKGITYTIDGLIKKVTQWHHERNLIDGATDKDQLAKLIQEVGELSDNICKGRDVVDDIGDIMVVLINIAERNGLTLEHCLQVAYEDIKDRKGRMSNGVFIKEDD